ncbi:MAG: tetratricopeptide repeat protein [Anaerolineae bacterium]|nr:tetratricopeptide repeat protein [Anaerolineae bacterium]
MPGNQQLYEQAMVLGDGFAWDQQWEKATAAYARALQEYPEDTRSHNSLGFALLQAKRYSDALRVYMRAHQLDQNDPLPVEKSADVLDRLGRLKEAADQYIAVAEMYIAQGDLDKAIANWERATVCTPGLQQIHFKLAQAYERIGNKRAAVMQYLIMAFNFQRSGDNTRAIQACDRALRLEPSNELVLNARRAIEAGQLMAVPKPLEDNIKPQREEEVADVSPESPDGPLGEAIDLALGRMAEFALDGDLSAATTHAIQGIEMHKVKDYEEAIASYQRAESQGFNFPPVNICIGGLYVKLERWQEAQKFLERMTKDEEYAAGANHGLGQVMVGLKQTRKALDYLLTALEMADTSMALHAEEAEQIKLVYAKLRERMKDKQEADLVKRNAQYLKRLSGVDWKIRVQETRRMLASRIGEGGDELDELDENPEIIEAIAKIDKYIKQRMYTLAMEEAYYALERSPQALPIHQRMAQILMEEGKTQEAITKYNLVAGSFLARDDMASASSILYEVIKVAPADVGLRTSLIELLERQEKWDQVLDEYIGLGRAYYELADMEQARATYNEANRLAQRIEAPLPKRIEILSSIGELDMSRLDLRQAQRTFEQIRSLDPNNEKVSLTLMDIYYRLNNTMDATKQLDLLLRMYAQKRQGDLILQLLESLVTQRPNDMAIRNRLGSVYRQLGRKAEAIAQFDALGELQLEAGMYQDACTTIKQIIQLGPEDTEQYRVLLQQLGC